MMGLLRLSAVYRESPLDEVVKRLGTVGGALDPILRLRREAAQLG
jgi:hypothetical protein